MMRLERPDENWFPINDRVLLASVGDQFALFEMKPSMGSRTSQDGQQFYYALIHSKAFPLILQLRTLMLHHLGELSRPFPQ